MNALDHFRRGERLLAEAERTPAGPLSAKLVAQARAHFDAAQTLLTALNTFDMPNDDYKAWEEIALASQAPDEQNKTRAA